MWETDALIKQSLSHTVILSTFLRTNATDWMVLILLLLMLKKK